MLLHKPKPRAIQHLVLSQQISLSGFRIHVYGADNEPVLDRFKVLLGLASV